MKIRKRTGDESQFQKTNILHSIMYASMATPRKEDEEVDFDEIAKCANEVVKRCYDEKANTTKRIKEIVIDVLSELAPNIKKTYVLRDKLETSERERTWELPELGQTILKTKYLLPGETQHEFFRRVSNGSKRIEFLIRNKIFIPGGRILAGQGVDKNVTVSNCYFIPILSDSMEGIMDCAKDVANTAKHGGGTGIDISGLRPRGFTVNNAASTSSGAVSFLPIIDTTIGTIGQNNRRGAGMGSMTVTHPDIREFITVKSKDGTVTNMNLSVKVTNPFMEKALVHDNYWQVFDDYKQEDNAGEILDLIAHEAWSTGEPGVLYWDNVRNNNFISSAYPDYFKGVNPCKQFLRTA